MDLKSPIKKKNKHDNLPYSFSFLGTDMHSHLIPGIDDGSPSVETSLMLIMAMHQMGYNKIITTPHIMQGYYPNDRSTILPGCELLQRELEARNIPVRLYAAAEYFLDAGLIEAIQRNEALLTLSGKKLLVEISFVAPPIQLHDFLYQLQLKGYEPIIAHPERYAYYHRNMDEYKKLIDIGCELQLNLLSLTGHYGKNVKKAALKLLNQQWVAYLGTDLHHQRHAENLQRLLHDHALVRKLKQYSWKNDTL
jgi:tyrosine-protein phosphatase YwqE